MRLATSVNPVNGSHLVAENNNSLIFEVFNNVVEYGVFVVADILTFFVDYRSHITIDRFILLEVLLALHRQQYLLLRIAKTVQ